MHHNNHDSHKNNEKNFVKISLETMWLYSHAGKEVSNAFSWAALSPETQQLAAAAGNCSLLQSWSDPFVNNHASIAGGAVYAIDLASLNLTCVDGQLATDNLQAGCAAWANNTVQIASDLVNGVGRCKPTCIYTYYKRPTYIHVLVIIHVTDMHVYCSQCAVTQHLMLYNAECHCNESVKNVNVLTFQQSLVTKIEECLYGIV